jgi:hypothetical protein
MVDLVGVFDEYERLLLLSPAVARWTIIKRRVQDSGGYIRLRAELADGGLLEMSEYWAETLDAELARLEYSFHWQAADEQLRLRWDNAAHHPELPNAPHHLHRADGAAEGSGELPDLSVILRTIESDIQRS